MTPQPPAYCAYAGCAKLLVRHIGEKRQAFHKRMHCGRECAYRTLSARLRRPISHGTPSGYNIHLRRGEKPSEMCPACHQARLEWQRARYCTAKARATTRAQARRRAMRLVIDAHYEEYQLAITREYEKLAS